MKKKTKKNLIAKVENQNHISQEDLLKRVLPLIEKNGLVYRKFKNIYASIAKGGEVIESITSDGKETINTAEEGDFIVINQTEAGENYIIRQKKFHDRYTFLQKTDQGFSEYRPKGKVTALEISAALIKELNLSSPFYYEAPWGEKAKAMEADFFVCPLGDRQVYRIARKEFFETYQLDE